MALWDISISLKYQFVSSTILTAWDALRQSLRRTCFAWIYTGSNETEDLRISMRFGNHRILLKQYAQQQSRSLSMKEEVLQAFHRRSQERKRLLQLLMLAIQLSQELGIPTRLSKV